MRSSRRLFRAPPTRPVTCVSSSASEHSSRSTARLLQQRKRAVEREECSDADEETQVTGRVGGARNNRRDERIERPIPAQDLMDGLDGRLDSDGTFRYDLLIDGKLLVESGLEPLSERDRRD